MDRWLMRKRWSIFVTLWFLTIFTLGVGIANATIVETSLYYGDIILDGNDHSMPGGWNLNECPATITYIQDLSGAPNIANTNDWSQMGMVGLFGSGAGARMVGFLYDWGLPKFPVYPDNDTSLELDDKFNLQRFPNPEPWDETLYDVNCATGEVGAPFGSGSNYGIWFDRDGVDQWQDDMWGMVNGGTYNTDGIYDVKLVFDWSSNNQVRGIVCPIFFPGLANTWVAGGYGVPTGFYSGGWVPTGPNKIPAGLSFATDVTKMGNMQVYVGGHPDGGSIVIKDLTVTGCLNLEDGMATGGGWFLAEDTGGMGNVTPGGKATFGFVAKQKSGISSGQLEFQYQTDELNLKSTSYEWVTLAATQAMFEGVGRLNGLDGYKFRVRAVDGDKLGTGIDRFEIRIWTIAGDFDSPTHRAEGNLGGGQVVVHKK